MHVEKSGCPYWSITPTCIISWPFEDAPQEFKDLYFNEFCDSKSQELCNIGFVTWVPAVLVEKTFAFRGDPTKKDGLYIVKYSNGDYVVFES